MGDKLHHIYFQVIVDQDHLKTVYVHIDSERTPCVKVHTMSTNPTSKWDIQFDSGLVN